jgi:hypothetical protein
MQVWKFIMMNSRNGTREAVQQRLDRHGAVIRSMSTCRLPCAFSEVTKFVVLKTALRERISHVAAQIPRLGLTLGKVD